MDKLEGMLGRLIVQKHQILLKTSDQIHDGKPTDYTLEASDSVYLKRI